MRWTGLGHAMWHVEAAGLRLLCDPTLERTHHGGVFEVYPPRRIRPEGLRPDFLLVSHRHTDHFDVPSLHRLARLDPDTVVVTPDALVAWACRELGFRTVHEVAPGQRVELDGLVMVTTPSVAPLEWGVAIATADGVVWNQVDTVLQGPAAVREVVAEVLDAVGHPRVSVTLARWHPLLEIAAQTGRRTAFPYDGYAGLLEQIAAVPTAALVPSAAGAGHAGPHRWMDRIAYPLPEARFLRDVVSRCPGLQVWPARVGDAFELRRGEAQRLEGAGVEHVEWLEGATPPDSRQFDPLHVPALRDANPAGHAEAVMWAKILAWIHGDLMSALQLRRPELIAGLVAGPDGAVEARLALRVVGPDRTEELTLRLGSEGVRVTAGLDPDWDGLNGVTLSGLYAVLEGERHWGDVLLAGDLRGRTRAYRVDPAGLHAQPLAELFLYYGLSYADAEERNTRWAVRRALERV